MAKEIERKYLLMEDGIDYSTELFKDTFVSIDNLIGIIKTKGVDINQGYLDISTSKDRLDKLYDLKLLKEDVNFKPTILRLRKYGQEYLFTIKGSGKMERDEIEFPISKKLFDKWWIETKGVRVKKRRYTHPFKSLKLEIDLFTDRNLMIMEIECVSISKANHLPEFGKDVTMDSRYANRKLAR